MDDAAPHGAAEDVTGSDPVDASRDTAVREEPVGEYAPGPREEVPPRLDLDHDPFAAPAPAFPVLDPEPLIAAIDGASDEPDEPDTSEEPRGPDAAAAAPVEVAGDEDEVVRPDDDAERAPEEDVPLPTDAPDAEVGPVIAAEAEAGGASEQTALSLEDMVDELKTAEDSSTEAVTAPREVDGGEAPAQETGVGPQQDVEEEPVEAATWREAAAVESAGQSGPVLARQRLASRLPFWVYGVAWAAFVGVLTYLMWPLSSKPFVDSPYYMYFVFGGAGLLVAGLVLAVVAWAVARAGTSPVEREGLVRAVLLRAVGWSAVGVTLWWAGMYALDLHRTGIIG